MTWFRVNQRQEMFVFAKDPQRPTVQLWKSGITSLVSLGETYTSQNDQYQDSLQQLWQEPTVITASENQ